MTKNLPAYRYDLFVKVFEKRVTAMQQEIERLRGMELLYNIVKGALESLRLPNEQSLNVHSGILFATIRAVPDDLLSTFEPAVKAIGGSLREAGLHDGEPSVSMGGDSCDVDYTWRLKSNSVWLSIKLPSEGLPDVAVELVERQTLTHNYLLTLREPPVHRAPGRFNRIVGTRKAGLVAFDDEVPF